MNTIEQLFEIVSTLRGEGGCSWDRKQTPETMMSCLEEEVYELQEAISKKETYNICEELGDTLFQLVFIARIFQERKAFEFSEVIEKVASKMIRRHPHVYGDAVVKNHQALIDQWESIKAGEAGKKRRKEGSALDTVPKGMPAMLRALKVSKCAVKKGFEWDDIHEVLSTVRSELDEFEAAFQGKDTEAVMLELGDIMFTMVNVARMAGFHPETALSASTAKFEGRFRKMEELLKDRSLCLEELPKDEKEQFWGQAKKAYDKK